MTTPEFLKAITEATGVSGYEHQVRELTATEFAAYSDEIQYDSMGSVWGHKRGRGGKRRILLAGHMDEIGLIVSRLDGHVLRFTQVGGFDVRTLPGQPVMVHGRRSLPGTVGTRPPHVVPQEERAKVIPMTDLFIDVGLTADELTRQVRVGDLVTVRRGYVELRNGLVASKAMDDRAGVAAIYECLKVLSGLHHDWDVYAVATVQEEVGLRGATTCAYCIAPDAAIAIDVTFARTPDLPEYGTVDIDKGPGIARGPNVHPVMFARLEETAKKHEIPYQVEAVPGPSGTDAWAIQVAREGIPTGLLGLPLRYMHTPTETLSLRDIERTGRLMANFIAGLTDEFAAELTPALPEDE